uniref:Glutamate receptor 3 n=1 Tax=Cacopsylla melanoneura TaxID=428564 RepID=A0A8D9EA54_9HEMI
MLMNGTADVRLVPVIVTTADNEDFDFTLPVAQNWYELFTRSDDDGASSLSYIVTWSDKLWFAFAGTCLLLSLITYSMLYLRYNYRLEKLDDEIVDPATAVSPDEGNPLNKTELMMKQKYTNISLGNCFLNVLGSFTSQGCECPSRSYSIRLVILVCLFFGLLMNTSYSAVLVSRLATGQKEILFPTLTSVAQAKTHTLCVRTGSFAYVKLKERETDSQLKPEWRDIVNKLPACLNESSQQNIANAICKDNVVVLETPIIMAAILKDLERTNSCPVMRMAGRNAKAVASLFMTKWNPLRQDFNEIIFRMHTTGILDYLQQKWLSRTMPDYKELVSSEVRMDHIAGVLLVYFLAILLSSCILMIEILSTGCKYNNTRPGQKPNKNQSLSERNLLGNETEPKETVNEDLTLLGSYKAQIPIRRAFM